jgi:hypothetical protein
LPRLFNCRFKLPDKATSAGAEFSPQKAARLICRVGHQNEKKVKKTALVIVLLYACLLVVLSVPVLLGSFYPEAKVSDVLHVFSTWQYWIVIALMLLCETALLLVPVKLADRRPISRRMIYFPVVASAFLMGCLLFGLICSVTEFFQKYPPFKESWQNWSALGASALLWIAWVIIFSRVSRHKTPRDILSQQCHHLIKGSALSLLVAVPTHIVARHRDYCCAGTGTFIGIVFGLSVLLLSFGPGIFFLYVARWKQLHPSVERNGSKENIPTNG